MRHLIFLFLFFSLNLSAQESKPRFWQNFYLELNGNLSNTSYISISTNSDYSIHHYISNSKLWVTSDVGLHYRNKYLNCGVNVHTYNNSFYQVSLGGNALQFGKNSSIYLGPFVSYGQQFGNNDFYFNRYIGCGIESYIKSIHLSLSYQFFNAYYAMRGLNFQIGSSVRLFNEKKNPTTRFLTNCFVEGNAGIERVKYSKWGSYTATGGYFSEDYKELIPQVELALVYRNKAIKLGAECSFSQSIGPVFGLNLLTSYPEIYLGPFLASRYYMGTHNLFDSKLFSEFGLETYVMNVHFSLGYSLYSYKLTDNSLYSNLRGITLKFGYAVPLSKNKKKINK